MEEEIEGIEAIEPAYGIPSRWIKPENRDRAELYGYTVIDPLSVLLMHLSEVIRQHSYETAYKTGSGKAYGKSEKNSS